MIRVDPARLATDPAAAAPDAGPRALVERQVAMLTRLAEMGMAIAEAATAAATGTATAAPAGADVACAPAGFPGDPVLAYTRAARAVRLSLALQTQLYKDLAALEAGEAAARAKHRERLGEVVRRGVVDTHAEAGWRRQGDLADYARESLKEAEDDADLLGLPFADAVARICADLALSPEWTARAVAAAERALPSSSALRRGSSAPPQDGGATASPTLDVGGDEPEDDEEPEDTFLEWPPPAPT